VNEILNPYIAGAPVIETSMFFGRDDVFSWIERSLAGKFGDHILVIHGQRRVGKTSVLKQIPNYLSDRYIQVFFDLQGRTNTTLNRFLWWLAREITRTLKQERGISIPTPDRDDFSTNPEYLINTFLPSLRSLLGNQILLLTFDEFDTLDRQEIQKTLAVPLIAYLRRMMEFDWLNFVFSIGSSGDKLENMQASYTDFFKSALYRKVSFLTRGDSLRLITKPVEGIIMFDPNSVDRIYEITSGHPYFTQLVCHELFSLCQKTGSRGISKVDVESVLDDVIERGTVNLKFVWDEANDLEKWVLAALAQLDGGVTSKKLSQILNEQRVRFSESDLISAIIHLRDKDVIDDNNQLVIHLMRMWLQANRSLDRVREELVDVNPIANRYIEIGDEYRDLGQSHQAINSYQQALNVDSDNLKAQLSIAYVHLKDCSYLEAAAAFELALQIDDEDVVARTGYCDANLALGDLARANDEIDKAIEYYQKVLLINQAHTDSRQRLADIFKSQAEEFLTDKKVDDALSAYNQAIAFTPEDEVLTTRFNDLLAQEKSKGVADLINKAERALSRQRWDDAVDLVEAALKLDPENAELQTKLVEIKDAPRQYKIQEYRHEAEEAIKRGAFDKAISAIETASQLAPEDSTLVEWLESVRSDQLSSQLDLYHDQAERAIDLGDWESAIRARKQALNLSPDDPALAQALADTESAKFQSQLDSCLREAKSARTSQNWDSAIQALEQYLAFEPNDPNILAEIRAIAEQKRQSQLLEFKDRAEKATQTEKWDEAVKAWEKYLELTPEDQKKVEDDLRFARKYAKIANDYSEAQQALRKKRHRRAIELLQAIIAKDPSYKATSRLLVEVVEANKVTPFWRKPWVYWVSGAAVIVVLGVLIGPRLWSAISKTQEKTSTVDVAQKAPMEEIEAESVLDISLLPSETPTPVETEIPFTPTLTILIEEETLTPSLTPTESPPAFYELILDYIESEPPTFEDDFSTRKLEWGSFISHESTAKYVADSVVDGVLHLTPEPENDETSKIRFPNNGLFDAKDFVLEIEFILTVYQPPNNEIGIRFRDDRNNNYYHLTYEPNLNTWFVKTTANSSNMSLARGNYYSTPRKIMIIAKGDDFALFFDEIRVDKFQDASQTGDRNYIEILIDSESYFDIDNLKFWNLDGVALVQPTETAIQPDSTNLLYKKRVIYEAIVDLDLIINPESMVSQLLIVSENIVLGVDEGSGDQIYSSPIPDTLRASDFGWGGISGSLALGGEDGSVKILEDYDGSTSQIEDLIGMGSITAIKYLDMFYLAAGTNEGNVAVWLIKGGNDPHLVTDFHWARGRIFEFDKRPVSSQFLIATESDGVQIWEMENWNMVTQLEYPSYSASWSPDGRFIALEDHTSGTSDLVIVKFSVEQTRISLPTTITRLVWSPDGNYIATVGEDDVIRLWSGFDENREITALTLLDSFIQNAEITDIVWSLDGDIIFVSDVDGFIWAWNLEGAEVESYEETVPEAEDSSLVFKRLFFFDTPIRSLDWSSTNDYLVSTSGEPFVVIISSDGQRNNWDRFLRNEKPITSAVWVPGELWVTKGDTAGDVWTTSFSSSDKSPDFRRAINGLDGLGEISDLSFTEDGSKLVVSTNQGYLAAWDSASEYWLNRTRIDTGLIYDIDWSPNGLEILTISENEGLQVFDDTLNLLRKWDHRGIATDWSPDGKFFVIGDNSLTDGYLALDILTSEGDAITQGKAPALINKVVWSPNSTMIAMACVDGTVRLWNLSKNGELSQTLKFTQDSEVTELAWSPDGTMLAAGDINGYIWVWQVP